jgi:hypothetical protein
LLQDSGYFLSRFFIFRRFFGIPVIPHRRVTNKTAFLFYYISAPARTNQRRGGCNSSARPAPQRFGNTRLLLHFKWLIPIHAFLINGNQLNWALHAQVR